jgi:hypothetical protein
MSMERSSINKPRRWNIDLSLYGLAERESLAAPQAATDVTVEYFYYRESLYRGAEVSSRCRLPESDSSYRVRGGGRSWSDFCW